MTNKLFIIRPINWLFLLLLGLLWGSSFYVNAVLINDLPSVSIVFFRIFSAAIFLQLVVFFSRKKQKINNITLLTYVMLALSTNILPFLLIVWAQQYIPSVVTSIVNSFTPMAALILSIKMVPEDKITMPRIIALLLGVGGVIVLIGIDSLNYGIFFLIPLIAIVSATFCYGFGANLVYRIKKCSLLILCANQLIVASIILFPFWLVVDQPWKFVNIFDFSNIANYAIVFLHLIWIGVFSTALAYLTFYKLISEIGPSNGALVTFIVPIVSFALGVFILDEILNLNHIVGFFLVASALLMINLVQLKRKIK